MGDAIAFAHDAQDLEIVADDHAEARPAVLEQRTAELSRIARLVALGEQAAGEVAAELGERRLMRHAFGPAEPLLADLEFLLEIDGARGAVKRRRVGVENEFSGPAVVEFERTIGQQAMQRRFRPHRQREQLPGIRRVACGRALPQELDAPEHELDVEQPRHDVGGVQPQDDLRQLRQKIRARHRLDIGIAELAAVGEAGAEAGLVLVVEDDDLVPRARERVEHSRSDIPRTTRQKDSHCVCGPYTISPSAVPDPRSSCDRPP